MQNDHRATQPLPDVPASTIFHRALLCLIVAGSLMLAGYRSGLMLMLAGGAAFLIAGIALLRLGCHRLARERGN